MSIVVVVVENQSINRLTLTNFFIFLLPTYLFFFTKMDTEPVKDGISDSMKARLMKEAGTGLDSETKQDNVILYIILGVAVLAVIGGAGTLY
jgi:hypothetical protein